MGILTHLGQFEKPLQGPLMRLLPTIIVIPTTTVSYIGSILMKALFKKGRQKLFFWISHKYGKGICGGLYHNILGLGPIVVKQVLQTTIHLRIVGRCILPILVSHDT